MRSFLNHIKLVIILTLNDFNKFNWFSWKFILNIWMLTLIHDIFIKMIIEKIKSQLKEFTWKHMKSMIIINKVTSETTLNVYLYKYEFINESFF